MIVYRLMQEGDPPASPRGYRIPQDDVHSSPEARYTG